MAITVESEKQKSPLVTVAIVIVVVVILAVGTYYLFFSSVPAIQDIVVPSDLQSITQVSKVNIDTIQSLTSSTTYSNLKSQVPTQQLNGYGRSNPFQPY